MLTRIDHIGVVVADLEESKRFLAEVLRLPLDREVDATAQLGALTAFYRCGDTDIELIYPVDPERRRARLGGEVHARVEHIAFQVEELAPVRADLERHGVRTTTEEPVQVGNRLNLFTRPESSGDVMYQLLQLLDRSGEERPGLR